MLVENCQTWQRSEVWPREALSSRASQVRKEWRVDPLRVRPMVPRKVVKGVVKEVVWEAEVRVRKRDRVRLQPMFVAEVPAGAVVWVMGFVEVALLGICQ